MTDQHASPPASNPNTGSEQQQISPPPSPRDWKKLLLEFEHPDEIERFFTGDATIALALGKISADYVQKRTRVWIQCAILEARQRLQEPDALQEELEFVSHPIDPKHRRIPPAHRENIRGFLRRASTTPSQPPPLSDDHDGALPQPPPPKPRTPSKRGDPNIGKICEQLASVSRFEVRSWNGSYEVSVVPDDLEKATKALEDLQISVQVSSSLDKLDDQDSKLLTDLEALTEVSSHPRVDGTIGAFLFLNSDEGVLHHALTAHHCLGARDQAATNQSNTTILLAPEQDAAVFCLANRELCTALDELDNSHLPIMDFVLPTEVTQFETGIFVTFENPDEPERHETATIKFGDPVFKLGSKTGLTCGSFGGLLATKKTRSNTFYENVCLVRRHAHSVFSKKGDSGSLYFVHHTINNVVYFVPFALHVARDGATSIGYPLPPIFQSFYGEDVEFLSFCSRTYE